MGISATDLPVIRIALPRTPLRASATGTATSVSRRHNHCAAFPDGGGSLVLNCLFVRESLPAMCCETDRRPDVFPRGPPRYSALHSGFNPATSLYECRR